MALEMVTENGEWHIAISNGEEELGNWDTEPAIAIWRRVPECPDGSFLAGHDWKFIRMVSAEELVEALKLADGMTTVPQETIEAVKPPPPLPWIADRPNEARRFA